VEEDGKPTAIRPRHIAILFRRFRNQPGSTEWFEAQKKKG